MNLAFILIIAAVVALGIVVRLTVAQSLQGKRSVSLAAAVRPIDIEAFRHLINPAEDQFLRRRSPPAQFRAVLRSRLLAMSAYVQAAGTNAAALVRVG